VSWFNKKLGRWVVLVDGRQMYRYRWVMEQHLGRPLEASEHVHHINGDSTDDRIENLQLIGPGEHSRLHLDDRQQARARFHAKGAWAEGESCTTCGTTDEPHYSLGMCQPCYRRDYYRRRRERAAHAAACVRCGAAFTAYEPDGKYCSSTCNSAAAREAHWGCAA
jgi:hypothetical protein